MQRLQEDIPPQGLPLYQELKDAMEMTALRAAQVLNLYATVNAQSNSDANVHLNRARNALDRAQAIATEREQHYRVDADRIASWDYNPTAYHFGYLWSVRTLHYWWRDEGKTVDRPLNPGYLNIMDPVDLANGETDWVEAGINLSRLRHLLSLLSSDSSWFNSLMFEPQQEYQYPPNDLRSRPDWYYPLPWTLAQTATGTHTKRCRDTQKEEQVIDRAQILFQRIPSAITQQAFCIFRSA